MTDTETPPLWYRLAPVIFVVIFSGGYAFAKLGLAHAAPLTFLALRHGVVLVALIPVLLWVRPHWPVRRQDWLHNAVIGMMLQGGFFAGVYWSLMAGVPSATVAIVVALQPMVVGLLAPWLVGEEVNRRLWLGLAMGFIGAMIVLLGRSGGALAELVSPGVLFAVLSLVTMAASTLYERRFGGGVHPVAATVIQHVAALVVISPGWAWLEWSQPIAWTGELWVALLYLGLGNSLISLTLLLAMIRRGGAARASALFYLGPPVAALIAVALLGEQLPLVAWAGIVVASVGVALARKR